MSQQHSTQLRSQIVCLSSLISSTGSKKGSLLCESIPVLLGFVAQEEDEQDDCDDLESLCELREACIHCFEALVKNLKGIEACTTHLPTFIDICVKYTSYDPNFTYDDDDD